MNDIKHDMKDALENTLGDLRSMRDEIRLKVHLAGMDVRERWRALEPKLTAVEQQIQKGGSSVAETVREQLQELRRSFTRLRDEVVRKSHA